MYRLLRIGVNRNLSQQDVLAKFRHGEDESPSRRSSGGRA